MESCNDNFLYAKKLSGQFLHLGFCSLYVHTYKHYIHIILKSSVLKSEYLNLNRLGWAAKVFGVGWRGVGHILPIFYFFATKTDLLVRNWLSHLYPIDDVHGVLDLVQYLKSLPKWLRISFGKSHRIPGARK